jgi:small-conductance mechanosensitive channel
MDTIEQSEERVMEVIKDVSRVVGIADFQQFLKKKPKFRYADVIADEGMTFRLRSMTAKDSMEWNELNEKHPKTSGINLIVVALVDDNGNRIAKEEDIVLLMEQDYGLFNRLVDRCYWLNHLGRYAPKTDEVGVEAAKND